MKLIPGIPVSDVPRGTSPNSEYPNNGSDAALRFTRLVQRLYCFNFKKRFYETLDINQVAFL